MQSGLPVREKEERIDMIICQLIKLDIPLGKANLVNGKNMVHVIPKEHVVLCPIHKTFILQS